MKRVILLMMIILALNVFAEEMPNASEPVSSITNEFKPVPLEDIRYCGNRRPDYGESCTTCPGDMRCPEGTTCVEGKCIPNIMHFFGLNSIYHLIFAIAAVLIIVPGAIILYRRIRKKRLDKQLNDNSVQEGNGMIKNE